MASSMQPASLATSLANSVSTFLHSKTSNPLAWTDDKIHETVKITHVHTSERFDVESLFILTSNILKRSTAIADSVVSKVGSPVGLIEDKVPLHGYQPPFRKLKHISAQMITRLPGEHHAHMTTMSILDQLKTHTWDGKAIFALAAFSLEYGNFWHLVQTPSDDTLGRSLATMNRVQSVDKHRQAISDYNSLVKNLLSAVECITELEKLSTKGFDTKDVPALPEAMQEIPVAVYWAIITAIICANHLDLLAGYSDDRYELSSFDMKLASIVSKLKAHLTRIRRHIAELEEFWRRKKIFHTSTRVLEVIEVLIFHNEIQDLLVYDCLNRKMVSIDVFDKKHVLVFISGLESIQDEILLLRSIHKGLQEDPRELKGYKKEDFKILWIPIVDEWRPSDITEFDSLKQGIPGYAVEYFHPLAGIRLIREELNYKNKPILAVLNPEGRVVNYNAMHLIFVWGIDAFPFRPEDDEVLVEKWKWFWAEMNKVFPKLQEIIKGDTFIFIYGGTDPKLTNDFSLAIEKIRRHEIIRKADAVIEQYHFGKEDKRIFPRFWDGIDSLFRNMRHKQGPTKDEIQSLLVLKDQPGWVVLSKGQNVKLLGPGDRMLATAIDFETWKEKVLEKAGFDVAFKEYYEKMPFPTEPCSMLRLNNYPADSVDPIYCLESNCRRPMEIASVCYKCCHGHTHQKSDVPAESGVVHIEKRP